MRQFAGLELVEDAIPDETTVLKFRHLLEQYRLTAARQAGVDSAIMEKAKPQKSSLHHNTNAIRNIRPFVPKWNISLELSNVSLVTGKTRYQGLQKTPTKCFP